MAITVIPPCDTHIGTIINRIECEMIYLFGRIVGCSLYRRLSSDFYDCPLFKHGQSAPGDGWYERTADCRDTKPRFYKRARESEMFVNASEEDSVDDGYRPNPRYNVPESTSINRDENPSASINLDLFFKVVQQFFYTDPPDSQPFWELLVFLIVL